MLVRKRRTSYESSGTTGKGVFTSWCIAVTERIGRDWHIGDVVTQWRCLLQFLDRQLSLYTICRTQWTTNCGFDGHFRWKFAREKTTVTVSAVKWVISQPLKLSLHAGSKRLMRIWRRFCCFLTGRRTARHNFGRSKSIGKDYGILVSIFTGSQPIIGLSPHVKLLFLLQRLILYRTLIPVLSHCPARSLHRLREQERGEYRRPCSASPLTTRDTNLPLSLALICIRFGNPAFFPAATTFSQSSFKSWFTSTLPALHHSRILLAVTQDVTSIVNGTTSSDADGGIRETRAIHHPYAAR